MSGQPTLGLLLVRANKITREQLYEALREQRATGARLGDILFEHGWIGEEELAMLLAQQLDLPFIEAKQLEKIPPLLIDKLPAKVAGEYRVLPVKLLKGKLTVAMDDQKTRNYLDELSYLTGATCIPALASASAIRASIMRHYGIDLPERADAVPQRKRGKAAARPVPEPVAERPVEKLEALPVPKTDAQGRETLSAKNAAGEDQVFLLTDVLDDEAAERSKHGGNPVSPDDEPPPPPAKPRLAGAVKETRREPKLEPRHDPPPRAPDLEPQPSSEPRLVTLPDDDEPHDNFLAPEAAGEESKPAWRPKGTRRPEATPTDEIWPENTPAPTPVATKGEPAPVPVPIPVPIPPARAEEEVREEAPPAVTTEAPIPDFDIIHAAEKLFEQTDPVGIGQVIVSFARNLVDRAILFDISGNPYKLLARAGSFLDDDDRSEGFKASAEELALLGVIGQTQQPSYGPTPPGEMYERFFEALGVMKPPFILLYPLVVTGKTKAVLFGGLGSARPADEFGDLQLLFKEAATAWEILLPS